MSGPRRRPFIDAIREGIANNVPFGTEADTFAAIDSWTAGNDPQTPLEAGVFEMCNKVATDLDAMSE